MYEHYLAFRSFCFQMGALPLPLCSLAATKLLCAFVLMAFVFIYFHSYYSSMLYCRTLVGFIRGVATNAPNSFSKIKPNDSRMRNTRITWQTKWLTYHNEINSDVKRIKRLSPQKSMPNTKQIQTESFPWKMKKKRRKLPIFPKKLSTRL